MNEKDINNGVVIDGEKTYAGDYGRPEDSRAALVEQMTIEENGVVIEDDREKWGKKLDFMLSCIGYAVGLGNVWRFPYLCYENGGATFLIPYFVMLAINGIPLFYMELAIGQYLSLGTVGAWTAICPLARGIGFGMIIVSLLVSIYYNMIIAWCLLYMFESFRKDVPWKTCENDWNTRLCAQTRANASSIDCAALGYAAGCKSTSPSEEFFNRHILQISESISDMGDVSWQIVLCLILAWIIVYLCLIKGVASSGKVVYFTATFPYVVLFILMIRGATLDGSLEGVIFYLKPDVQKLKDPQVQLMFVRLFSKFFSPPFLCRRPIGTLMFGRDSRKTSWGMTSTEKPDDTPHQRGINLTREFLESSKKQPNLTHKAIKIFKSFSLTVQLRLVHVLPF